MSRNLNHTRTVESYDITAKSLKKGDRVWVGKRVHKVTSNKKSLNGHRAIRLGWGSQNEKDEVTLVVPSKLVFTVQTTTFTRHTK